jgi:HEAT repeat protein
LVVDDWGPPIDIIERGAGLTPSQKPLASPPTPRTVRPGSIRSLLIAVVPILLVLITFLFWYQTWFGRPLTDQEMQTSLANTSVPHRTQHALAQLAERMARDDVTARRWYPQILTLARSQEPQLRLMAAWAMGQDNHSAEFHQALLSLLHDPVPMVQWNAALALARFGDVAGESQLQSMLRPNTVDAPAAGTLELRLKEQDEVRRGSTIARIRPAEGSKTLDVVSPLDGEVARLLLGNGAKVTVGSPVAVIAPGEKQVWESLRALYLVGQVEDLEDVDRFARGVPHMSERIRQQAAVTARVIRERGGRGKG